MAVSVGARLLHVAVLLGFLWLALYFPYLWFGVVPFAVENDISEAEIESLGQEDYLPTGVKIVDEASGGLPLGEVGMYVAASGSGKSMWLDQMFATALMLRFHAVYVSLELPRATVLARTCAALLGRTTNYVRGHAAECGQLIRDLNLPPLRVFKLDADVTPFFKRLINSLRQMNYTAFDTEAFKENEAELRDIIAERSAS